MTREEAIQVMFYVKNHFWNDAEVNTAIDMGIAALLDQKTRKWIPCSERMPKHDTKVLVQTEYGLITDGRFSSELNIWFTMDGYTCYKVVAWMPLPEPYNETNGKI